MPRNPRRGWPIRAGMPPADLSAEVQSYIARSFEAVDRGFGLALARLATPRRYHPERVDRALEMLMTQLAGYAIGLVGASVASALAQRATRETSTAIRDELARIAEGPVMTRRMGPCTNIDSTIDRERGPRGVLTVEAFHEQLRERLLGARADAHTVVARVVGVALASAPRDRATFAGVLASLHGDDLVPYRFSERIETGWRETCEALAQGRAPTAPPLVTPALVEPGENYCWMRIR